MTTTDTKTDDVRFEEVLAAYLEASDAGWAPARKAFLDRYPHWRGRLEAFFSMTEEVAGLTRSLLGRAEPSPAASGDGSSEGLPRPFGEYELVRLLGRGGMGVVYLARRRSPERVVALKVASPASGDDVQRFRN